MASFKLTLEVLKSILLVKNAADICERLEGERMKIPMALKILGFNF